MVNTTNQWWFWNSSEELGSVNSFYTDEYYTDGDGYTVDFSLGNTSEEFKESIDKLLNNNEVPFLTHQTAIIIINFNCYLPSQDRFISTSMTIEFSTSGMLVPYPIKIISFSWDLFEQTTKMALIIDGFQIFFCCCYLFRALFLKAKVHLSIINYYQKTFKKKNDDEGNDNEEEEEIEEEPEEEIEGYSASCSIATDLIVVVFFLLKLSFSLMTFNNDIGGLLNDNYLGLSGERYIELVHYADYYLEQY